MSESRKTYESLHKWVWEKKTYQIDDIIGLNYLFKDLIKSYFADVKQEVERVYKNWNNKTREFLKSQMAFNLKSTNELDKQGAISIKVTDEVPPSLWELFKKHDYIIWELIFNSSKINKTIQGLGFFNKIYNDIHNINKEKYNVETFLPLQTSKETIHQLKDEFSSILDFINSLNILKDLREGGDVFGSYNIKTKEVKLYWLTIGLYAISKGYPIELVTLVILSHELAHGYSHIGYDIDGANWNDNDFMNTDLAVVEGIAEYYSREFCKSLDRRDLFDVYEELLREAPIEYTKYTEWIPNKASILEQALNEKKIGEKLRSAIRKVRLESGLSFEDFSSLIKS